MSPWNQPTFDNQTHKLTLCATQQHQTSRSHSAENISNDAHQPHAVCDDAHSHSTHSKCHPNCIVFLALSYVICVWMICEKRHHIYIYILDFAEIYALISIGRTMRIMVSIHPMLILRESPRVDPNCAVLLKRCLNITSACDVFGCHASATQQPYHQHIYASASCVMMVLQTCTRTRTLKCYL